MDKKLKLIKDEEEQKSILKLCELGVITNKILYEPIIFNNKNKFLKFTNQFAISKLLLF